LSSVFREAEKSAAREKEETDTHATDGESTSGCRTESDVFAATDARSSDAMMDRPEIELLSIVFDLENDNNVAFLNGEIRLCAPYFPRPHFLCRNILS
jgi:hypothetical protein